MRLQTAREMAVEAVIYFFADCWQRIVDLDIKIEEQKKTEIAIPDETGLGNWLIRLLKGVLIGIGGILPGLSGGVLAVIFEIYDHIMIFLSSITTDFFKRMRYFLPIGIGGILGILLFSVAVAAAFDSYGPIFVSLFLGFVVGTLPLLGKRAKESGRGAKEILSFVLATAAILAIMLIGVQHLPKIEANFFVWIAAGFLIGLGVIIPGLATSNFLMYLGLYDTMAHGVKDFDLSVMLPLIIGVLLTVILMAKAVTWLFNNYYSLVHHVIIGLVTGSCLAIIPTIILPGLERANLAQMNLNLLPASLFCLAAFFLGTIFSYLFSLLEKKYGN